MGEWTWFAANLNNIGTIHGSRGEYTEALEIFLQVSELARGDLLPESQRPARLSKVLTNISNVYSVMGNHERALEFAKEGLHIKKDMGDVVTTGISLIVIGDIFKNIGAYDSALHYYNKSIELAPPNFPRYIPNILEARQSMSGAYAEMGDLEKAIRVLSASMELRLANENYKLGDAFNLMALYHHQLGQLDSSIYYSRKALEIAVADNYKPTSKAATKRLSSAFHELGQYDSAYHYQALHHEFSDSIFNSSTLRKYNNLRIELETSEKQREIEVLEKQRVIDRKNRSLLIVSIIAILILSTALAIYLIYRHRNKQLVLKNEVEKGEMALQQQTLHMINLNNHIAEIESGLKSMKKQEVVGGKDLQSLLNNIFLNRSFEKEWEQLEMHFSKIHPNFNSQLMKRHDNLTQRERRLLALIKLDLNTREISGILSIEQRSVVMSRYRLKQKLGLEDDEDLDTYVQTF